MFEVYKKYTPNNLNCKSVQLLYTYAILKVYLKSPWFCNLILLNMFLVRCFLNPSTGSSIDSPLIWIIPIPFSRQELKAYYCFIFCSFPVYIFLRVFIKLVIVLNDKKCKLHLVSCSFLLPISRSHCLSQSNFVFYIHFIKLRVCSLLCSVDLLRSN